MGQLILVEAMLAQTRAPVTPKQVLLMLAPPRARTWPVAVREAPAGFEPRAKARTVAGGKPVVCGRTPSHPGRPRATGFPGTLPGRCQEVAVAELRASPRWLIPGKRKRKVVPLPGSLA